MTTNLSIRNYSIEIAGLDCTRALISFSGADTPIDQGGLIIFKGSLVLGRPTGFEQLDDRLNNRWAIGGIIRLQAALDGGGALSPPPRAAILRIIESSYDPKSKKLTIQFGDLLELLRNQQPVGDASKICLGTSVSRTQIVSTLLVASGAPALKVGDDIPGALNSPAPRLVEGSYIEQAGAIAAAAGYFLCVELGDDGLEVIRAIAIDHTTRQQDAIVIATAMVADLERVAGEAPPEELTVNAKAVMVRQNRDSTYNEGRNFGLMGMVGTPPVSPGVSGSGGQANPAQSIVIRQWQKSESFNRGSKTRTVTMTAYQPLGIVLGDDARYLGNTSLIVAEHRMETYTFEQNAPLAGSSIASHCEQGNQGRLLSSQVEVYQPRGVALREVFASYPKANVAAAGDKLALMRAEVTTSSYIYDLGGISQIGFGEDWAIETLGDGPQITTTVYRPVGAILPKEHRYRATGPMPDPSPLAVAESKSQTWRELRFGEWDEDLVEFKALALVDSASADRLRKLYKDDPGVLVNLLLNLQAVTSEGTISGSGQANPPSSETYPAAFSTKETTVKGRAKLPGKSSNAYRLRQKSLNFDYICAVANSEAAARAIAEAEASRLAGLWGPILWGQYKSTSYTTDFNDGWRGYRPLARMDVQEPEARFAYLGNGFAIAIAGNRCAVSFDGIFLGQSTTLPPELIGGTIPTSPTNPLQPVDIIPPYRRVELVGVAAIVAVQATARSHSTATVRHVANLAVTLGLKTFLGVSVRGVAVKQGLGYLRPPDGQAVAISVKQGLGYLRPVDGSEIAAKSKQGAGISLALLGASHGEKRRQGTGYLRTLDGACFGGTRKEGRAVLRPPDGATIGVERQQGSGYLRPIDGSTFGAKRKLGLSGVIPLSGASSGIKRKQGKGSLIPRALGNKRKRGFGMSQTLITGTKRHAGGITQPALDAVLTGNKRHAGGITRPALDAVLTGTKRKRGVVI